MASNAKSGGGAKIGNNKVKCKRYSDRMTRERNKTRKLKRHILRNPHDDCAHKAMLTAAVPRKRVGK